MPQNATIELYKPHAKQLEIHKALDRDDIMYCIVPTGRQFGKTWMGENQAIKWAVENKDWNILWVSPTYGQAKKVFNEMKGKMFDCPAFSKPPNSSDLIFYFNTGSEIRFYSASATGYDKIRGESATAVICDEFRFYHPLAWGEAIKPTLTVSGKKVLIISTTKGKGEFYTLYKLEEHESRYISFTASSRDNPYANQDEIDDAERNLPSHIFRQEYLGEFIEDGSEVFINIEECIGLGEESKPYYAGVDLGRADDYTVLTIVDSKNKEVYCERWRHMDWSKIIDNVVRGLNKYQSYTMVESNGAQDAIYEQIRNKVNYSKSKVKPFVTTSNSKQVIIEDLIVQFENKDLCILGHKFQMGELQAFTYEYNIKTRKIRYSAPLGLHDDYVMSRAICSHAHKTMKKRGVYDIR